MIGWRAARVDVGLTLDDASERLGISAETLSDYEKYRKSPTIEFARKMCALYGRDFDEIRTDKSSFSPADSI